MAISLYDSRSPAPGVRVAPYVGAKITGLTMGQARASRMGDRPFSLGMRSTVKTVRSPLAPVNPTRDKFWLNGQGVNPANTRPTGKRRAAKKRKHNTVFHMPIPTEGEYDRRDLAERIYKLLRLWRLVNHRGNAPATQQRLESKYEKLRLATVKLHGKAATEQIDKWERF